jgi:hypothetical protein
MPEIYRSKSAAVEKRTTKQQKPLVKLGGKRKAPSAARPASKAPAPSSLPLDLAAGKKPAKKREAKAPKAPKKAAFIEPNEDVEVPDQVPVKTGAGSNLRLEGSQTQINKEPLRATEIGDHVLFERCVKGRGFVTSLLEWQSPEQTFTCLERAIALNRVDILKTLLKEKRPENETRAKKKESQIAKFDTGAFEYMKGVKARKVNQLRGGREGNNALVADTEHEQTTPHEYLAQEVEGKEEQRLEYMLQGPEPIEQKTFESLKEGLGDQYEAFERRMFQTCLKTGSHQSLVNLFKAHP